MLESESISEIGTDSPTTNDLLGFKRFAEPIARRIANATDKGTPLTIGVYGEWGSGKTSFLKMIDEVLQTQDIYPIWFNAWKYDQEENLWSALIQTILDQARVSGKWYRRIWVKLKIWKDSLDLRSGSWEIAKGLLSIGLRIIVVGLSLLIVFGWSSSEVTAFLNQVFSRWFSSNPITLTFFQTSVIKTVIAIIAFFAAKPDEWLKLFDAKLGIDFSKLKRSKSYRAHIAFLDEFSEEFKRIIKLIGGGKPLVVIIDDLDRCLPEKAIQVLEAIKLFLDVEGCIFLLAVDRDVVERAIAVKYKDLLAVAKDTQSKPELLFTLLGENYFEKIVQLPFALPPISDKHFKDFVTKVYSDEHIRQCSEIFFEGLPRNPRKVKRLLQTFLLLRSFVGDGIKNGTMQPSLIAKVVIVQSQFRSVYEDLARFHALLAELEKLYRHQADSPDSDSPLNAITDPIVREKVEATAIQFPFLRRVLLQKVNNNDTFVDVDIEPYLSLTEATIEGPVGEASVQDTSAALGQYLRQVIYDTQPLSIQPIIPPSVELSSALHTDALFVQAQLTPVGDDGKRLEVLDILNRTARSVILGSPGSGKTTLLSLLAIVYARSLGQDYTSNVGITENLLPIFVRLREYGRYAREEGAKKSATPVSFLEFLDNYFRQWNIGLPSGFFTPYLERGSCILLLDGLDEVSPPERQFAVQTIVSLGRRYPTSRIIVTSRPAAYFPGLGEDFAHYVIADFDDDRIKWFVQAWSRYLSGDNAVGDSIAASLLAAIFGNDGLHTLARNPLLLTTIVILHSHRGVLPERRVDLYEDSLHVLLSRWDAAKGIRTTNLGLPEIKSLLATLAFSAQDAAFEKLDESFVLSVFSNALTTKGLSQSEAQSQSISLLETIQERAGILTQVAPNTYQFVHLTFQEYLASVALAESDKYIDLVTERCGNVIWQESIVLSVARVARASPRAAEDVTRALLETQSTEGILSAGRGLLEIMPVKNTELQEKVIKSLNALIADNQVVDSSREQAKVILDRLGQAQ
jgi:energy-coupling factor transporter ATP-binding protein EcfA2